MSPEDTVSFDDVKKTLHCSDLEKKLLTNN